MGKRDHHMEMIVEREKDDEFHRRAPYSDTRQHEALMKRLGLTPEEDAAWHKTQLVLGEQRAKGLKHIDPCTIGIAFSEYCVQQGWMVQRCKEYFVTKEGIGELRSRFDLSL